MVDFNQLAPRDVDGGTERFELADEVALITGAASGIGRVTAFRLADAGADVALTDRKEAQLEAVAGEVREAFDVRVSALPGDVSDRESVGTVVEEAVEELGGIDVLCNIAGVGRQRSTHEMSEDEWDLVQNVNLKGTFLCSQAAVPYLSGGGRIVNVSSFVAQYGSATMSHYAAAKAGIRNFTRSVAAEWAPRNVRVNAVAPGTIFTAGYAAFLDAEPGDAYDRSRIDRPIGSPAEVADVIVFLASPASSFVSGETLIMEGAPIVQEDFTEVPFLTR